MNLAAASSTTPGHKDRKVKPTGELNGAEGKTIEQRLDR